MAGWVASRFVKGNNAAIVQTAAAGWMEAAASLAAGAGTADGVACMDTTLSDVRVAALMAYSFQYRSARGRPRARSRARLLLTADNSPRRRDLVPFTGDGPFPPFALLSFRRCHSWCRRRPREAARRYYNRRRSRPCVPTLPAVLGSLRLGTGKRLGLRKACWIQETGRTRARAHANARACTRVCVCTKTPCVFAMASSIHAQSSRSPIFV